MLVVFEPLQEFIQLADRCPAGSTGDRESSPRKVTRPLSEEEVARLMLDCERQMVDLAEEGLVLERQQAQVGTHCPLLSVRSCVLDTGIRGLPDSISYWKTSSTRKLAHLYRCKVQ